MNGAASERSILGRLDTFGAFESSIELYERLKKSTSIFGEGASVLSLPQGCFVSLETTENAQAGPSTVARVKKSPRLRLSRSEAFVLTTKGIIIFRSGCHFAPGGVVVENAFGE